MRSPPARPLTRSTSMLRAAPRPSVLCARGRFAHTPAPPWQGPEPRPPDLDCVRTRTRVLVHRARAIASTGAGDALNSVQWNRAVVDSKTGTKTVFQKLYETDLVVTPTT